MSMLNHVHVGPVDTENHVLRTKQFNASGTQPSAKKKALADVKNTLHQKSAQQSKKPNNNLAKPSNYEGKKLFSGENEFNAEEVIAMKEKNLIGPKSEVLAKKLMANESDHDFVETCKCDELPDDYDVDMLFKDLKLTTKQIETYALNWENPPIVTAKDKRPLCCIDDLEKIETKGLGFDRQDMHELLTQMIPEVPQLETEVPPLFLEDEMLMNGSFDSVIGL